MTPLKITYYLLNIQLRALLHNSRCFIFKYQFNKSEILIKNNYTNKSTPGVKYIKVKKACRNQKILCFKRQVM